MRKIILVCILLTTVGAFGQSKNLWLKYADAAYEKKDYPTAISYYTKVLDDTTVLNELVLPYEVQLVNLKTKDFKQDSTKKKSSTGTNAAPAQKEISKIDYVNHRLAHAYRLNFDYTNAITFFKKVVNNGSYPGDAYYYALSLMSLKDYKTAMANLEELMNNTANDSVKSAIQKKISSCYFALDTNNNTKHQIIVKKMDTVVFNTGTASFAPMYWGSPTKLLFTSARKGGVLIDPEKQDSRYLCDLYYTELKDTGWMKAVNFGRPVNTGLHEASSVVSSDDIMFFTRWSDANRNESFIYMAKMKDGFFYEAYKLSETVNRPGYKAMQPYISFDGTKLFFSSNKPGGKGGFDLYMCNIDENGLTGEAMNLEALNTTGDEVTPFFHSISNTLFFASNGHSGLGGLDIFKSPLNVDDSVYAFPKNLGQPINSSKDDAYFILDRLQTKGYFSSDREDCPGGNCYDIYEFENEPIVFDISGYVTDDETGNPIASALVTIKDVHNDAEPLFLITDDKGYYSSPLKENMDYFLKAQKKSYQASSSSATTKGLTESAHLERDFVLTKIPEQDIVIEGIEYDLNKATLRPKSLEILNKIYDYLELNDNFSIEINSHTDTRGSDKLNMKLSQARAKSCVDYLISKGIAKERLIATGYGETQPLIPDSEIAKLVPKSDEFEEAHQKNRRTAFKILKEADLKTK